MAQVNLYQPTDLTKLNFNLIYKGWGAAFDIGRDSFLGINYAQVAEIWWGYRGEVLPLILLAQMLLIRVTDGIQI